MSALTLYFLVMLDNIITFIGVICAISWVVFAIYATIMCALVNMKSEYEESSRFLEEDKIKISNLRKSRNKVIKWGLAISIFITGIYCMIPTTKQVAFIYIASTLSQNKIVQDIGEKSLQIPDKALEILNLKMNEYLDDMKKEAVSEVKETTKEVKKEIVK